MFDWRLIIDKSLDGNTNMALDEALLESYLQGSIPPTLRFYKWSGDWVSIGYFQNLSREVDLQEVEWINGGVVRRPTGGRGVLHTWEITYSLVIGEDFPGLSKNVVESYKFLIQGIKLGLINLGLSPELKPVKKMNKVGNKTAENKSTSACFDSPSWYELLLENKKVVGSAQMRKKGAILQHGSIKLHFEPEKVARVFGMNSPKGIKMLKQGATGILDLSPDLDEERVLLELKRGFEKAFLVKLNLGKYKEHELERSEILKGIKYY